MGELITKDNFEKLQQKLEELKKRRVKISKRSARRGNTAISGKIPPTTPPRMNRDSTK